MASRIQEYNKSVSQPDIKNMQGKNITARIIPQKWNNHVEIIIKHGTIKKYFNAIKSLVNWQLNKSVITSKPSFLKIEVSNKCSVNCRYCKALKGSDVFPLEKYKVIISSLKDYIFEVSLHDIGEPLSADNISEFINYAAKYNIGTILSSSLSIRRSDIFWKKLINSGLDKIIVAIDGVTQEVYQEYRRRGDLELVFSNLEKIIKLRKDYESNLRIEWQMIDFPWNRHEQKKAQELAVKFGCDRFNLIHNESTSRLQYTKQKKIRKRNCLMPFIMLIITARLDVRPCCNLYKGRDPAYKRENIVGTVPNEEDIMDIWNTDELQLIRNKRKITGRDFCRTCQEM